MDATAHQPSAEEEPYTRGQGGDLGTDGLTAAVPLIDLDDDGPQPSHHALTPKASYALALQSSCRAILRKVEDDPMLRVAGWARPLKTAPAAISTMAILFKVADHDRVARLEVDSLDIFDDTNTRVVGKLA